MPHRGVARLRVVLLLAAALLLSGVTYSWLTNRCCGSRAMRDLPRAETPAARPRDFSVDLFTSTGTVAPKYYHRLRLRVGGDSLARVDFSPGYDTTGPTWSATFAVADSAIEALWADFQRRALRQAPTSPPIPSDQIRVGGGGMRYVVTASGRTHALDAERRDEWEGPIHRFSDAVSALLPDSILASFKARQAALPDPFSQDSAPR